MKWALLALAIASEVTGSLSLKAAIDHPGWFALVAAGYLASFTMLAAVLRLGVPLGIAYGIWGAGGVSATALMSHVIFDEPLTGLMLAGIAVIIAGVVTVELGSHRAAAEATS